LLPAAAAVVLLVILYGSIRMHGRSDRKEVSTGLIVLNESLYTHIYDTLPAHEVHIADLYLQETARLAAQGARVVLLPEKAIPVTDATDSMITLSFKDAARKLGITIIAGYTRIYKDHLENQALVISSEGQLITDYRKVKLFEWEPLQGFTAGKQAGIFDLDTIHAGVAICKDLDYQQYMLTYGRSGISILYVPAWDFVGDGWLHSRMAILRGVENGYPVVRSARQGRLTISDECGRVLYEAISEKGNTTVLLGKISPAETGTLYSRWGDWFGYLNLLAACYLIIIAIRKKSYSVSSPSTTR
jgi:apolipoprotein N-acyltransferase